MSESILRIRYLKHLGERPTRTCDGSEPSVEVVEIVTTRGPVNLNSRNPRLAELLEQAEAMALRAEGFMDEQEREER